MIEFLHHLFIPAESNNQRAKLLHPKSLFITLLILLMVSLHVQFTKSTNHQVLGITNSITIDQLLTLTNNQRQKYNMKPLLLNQQLSEAASLKANDMFTYDYWAHTSPNGTTPWYFIKKAGYAYIYAGENLARGFTTSSDTVNAWMASESHKANILSLNYTDIGFAIKEGKLTGEDTILIVQMFGSTKPIPQDTSKGIDSHASVVKIKQTLGAEVPANSFFNSQIVTKDIGLSLLCFLIFVFSLDLIFIKRKNVIRFVGHNIDHILYLMTFVIVILLIVRGTIL